MEIIHGVERVAREQRVGVMLTEFGPRHDPVGHPIGDTLAKGDHVVVGDHRGDGGSEEDIGDSDATHERGRHGTGFEDRRGSFRAAQQAERGHSSVMSGQLGMISHMTARGVRVPQDVNWWGSPTFPRPTS